MSEDSEYIARQWKQEVDAEIRREEQRRRAPQPWRAIVWSVLWLLWLVLLVVILSHFKVLR